MNWKRMLATLSGSVDQELLLRNEYRVTENRIRSVKTELLSKMILFGEGSLRHCLDNYVNHFHAERNHQGKGNVMLFPPLEDRIGEISGDEYPCAWMLFCRSHEFAFASILAQLRTGRTGQRIEPSQAGEPHEIRVVRVKSGVVLNSQRRNLCVRHQISCRAEILQ